VLNVASGLCFLGLVVAALLVALSEAGLVAPRRRFVNLFLAYAVAASFAAGLAQRDAWPFSKWPMAGGRAEAEYSAIRIVGVDEDGMEHAVDYRAWRPMAFDELMPWTAATWTGSWDRWPRRSSTSTRGPGLVRRRSRPGASFRCGSTARRGTRRSDGAIPRA
jgi:hypothetical protein